MSDKRDIGHGVMMPPMSMHTPRQWKEMLVEAQKDRIIALQAEIEQFQNNAVGFIQDIDCLKCEVHLHGKENADLKRQLKEAKSELHDISLDNVKMAERMQDQSSQLKEVEDARLRALFNG